MCWMMVIMTMRIIMTKETLRCCTFCSKHLHGEKCLSNIYIETHVWQTFTSAIQCPFQQTSFGGYFDVIIITTRTILWEVCKERIWNKLIWRTDNQKPVDWQYSLGVDGEEEGECKEGIVCETLFDSESLDSKEKLDTFPNCSKLVSNSHKGTMLMLFWIWNQFIIQQA